VVRPYPHGDYGTRIFAEAVAEGGLPNASVLFRAKSVIAAAMLARGTTTPT
jgi:hypothetical protein